MPIIRPTPSCLCLLLFVGALAACGGSSESPTAKTGSSSESPGRQSVSDGDETIPAPAATVSTADDQRLGAPLPDPSRYYGVYASAERPDRQWFVTEAKRPPYAEQAPEVPPGHLALGAMFGDVAPWHLRTLSETVFEQAWVPDHQDAGVSIEFEVGDDGRATALRFTTEPDASFGKLERQGDLPEGWE